MKYEVRMTKDAQKGAKTIPHDCQEVLRHLILDISEFGPIQPRYSNYSKIGKGEYHCHLAYHWVACWRLKNGKYYVEVYYVGSRESAPYSKH